MIQLESLKSSLIHGSPLALLSKHQAFKTKKRLKLFGPVDISDVFTGKVSSPIHIPLFESRVQAGFPAPADEYSEGSLDLNDYLLPHKATTFFVRVTGDSMVNVGIFPGDMLVVDRSLTPTYGKIVIALLNGEMTVKRLEKFKNRLFLCAENDDYPDIKITEEDHFAIWGVVTNVIHSLL
jgi:DNA polymerase V